MNINRSALLTDLLGFVKGGSGVVVGEPGVGKSFALAELAEQLKTQGIKYLLLPVERLGRCTKSDLKKYINSKEDLIELLKASNADSKRGGILILDGFDAARSAASQKGVLSFVERSVRELAGSWNVLVSVRTFDAAKSRRLLDLFPAKIEEA